MKNTVVQICKKCCNDCDMKSRVDNQSSETLLKCKHKHAYCVNVSHCLFKFSCSQCL